MRKSVLKSLFTSVVLCCAFSLSSCDRHRKDKDLYLEDGYFKDPQTLELVVAAMQGKEKKVAELVRSGVNVNAVGKDGMTPLYYVASQIPVNLEGFEALLKYGADPNYKPLVGPLAGVSVTYQAADMGAYASFHNPKLLRTILKYGGDPNIRNPRRNYQTALMAAAANGSMVRVKMLAKNAADVSDIDIYSVSALLQAVKFRHFDVALYLMQVGADYNTAGYLYSFRDKVGLREVLMCAPSGTLTAKQTADRESMVKWLLKKGVEVDRAAANGHHCGHSTQKM